MKDIDRRIKMKIKVFDNYEELSKNAALEIINQVKSNPESVIGFATGSSPMGLYNELINDYKLNNTSYRNILSFNLDEYFGIDRNHSQSYYHFMHTNLFKHIDIDDKNVNIPSGYTNNVKLECEAYNKKLDKNPIDVQILGIGRNGHIGFNEPGTKFDSVTHQVELDENTRIDNARFFSSLEEVPTQAVTMGIKNILNSKKVILIASGENKADAVYSMINGPVDQSCPASALQMHDNVVVFLDKFAAKKLKKA
ncbi:MAG: glucosamine-6-phosphate deaminase [Haloplasmataceae bacterium]|jgi:glucosamine-6-phosphate deaminase|nr:glucosamine-6-phosphate deaminase [Haloplasmataceae bacterium]